MASGRWFGRGGHGGFIWTAALWLLHASLAGAQPSGGAGSGADAPAISEPTRVAPDSPRASLGRFLELTGRGRFDEAAEYLDLPTGRDDGALLAEQLRGVLDHALVVETELLSPLPGGLADDGLPPWVDRVAEVVRDGGRREAVRMARRQSDEGPRWVFTRGTVRSIPAWYDELPDRWLRELLPESLLRPGPKGLLWWQWIALPVLILLALGLGLLLGWLTARVLRRATKRTKAEWDDTFAAQLRGPLTVAWGVALTYLALPWLLLPRAGEAFVHRVLGAGLFVVFFWALLRSITVIGAAVTRSPWAAGRPGAAALVPLIVRSGQVAIWIIGAIALLALFGYPVASLLAGLGIGGLVVALAAQKTMENFFGSVAIGVDQPFRPGDFVRVEDVIGTVETVGLRSTRIRTLDRTLVTIPNGKLAELQTETFAARDRIRLSCVLGLVFGTTAEQMRRALAGIEGVLRAHPKLYAPELIVRFDAIGASSLDIRVMAWFTTTEWEEYLAIRQEVLLGFLEAVERAGTSFAFPTQTVHLAGATAAAAEVTRS
jgi:MscS family membrane protein